MKTFSRMAWFVAAFLVATVGFAQNNYYLKKGDCVVFYGDSITDQRLYTTFIETYTLTRFPHLNVRFVHSGWGGDRVTGGGGGPIDLRLERDVIAYKPTVMTIMLGMNDGEVRPFDDRLFNTFTTGYTHIIDTVEKALPGIRITVIQPSPYDDVTRPPLFPGGYNRVLIRYGEWVKEFGQRRGLTIADLNTPVVADLEKARGTDPELAARIIPDRVHPGPGGHLIMAEAILKAWNAPATVTSVEIDATHRRLIHAENASITALKVENGLSWTEKDGALPMPIDMNNPVTALAVRSSDFVKALDQQLLRITGLPAQRYVLRIDGKEVGTFTRQQLTEGVNLAQLPTPMLDQAKQVYELTLKHNNIHYARWRDVQVPLANQSLPALKRTLGDLDKLEAEVVKLQRAAAQPQSRTYELVPE